MSLLETVLAQVGNVDLKGLAAKAGLPPEKVESALGALVQAQPQAGDTTQQAAAATGLPTEQIGALLRGIGGEQALAQIAALVASNPAMLSQVTKFLDRDGDGSVVDDLSDIAANFFKK